MIVRQLRIVFLIMCLFSYIKESYTQENIEEQQIKVSLRKIGHKVLLYSGDSASLVLPIEKEGDRYKIPFEANFEFDPYEIAFIIDETIKEDKIGDNYIVEIEKCLNKSVVHSYRIGDSIQLGQIACRGRVMPKDCYNVIISFLKPLKPIATLESIPVSSTTESSSDKKQVNYNNTALLILAFLILIGLTLYFLKKKGNTRNNESILHIGAYNFDKRNQTLQYNSEKTELTRKEADLLALLYSSANNVIEREAILNAIWGDEGDYIGRTLDVFISKLRKKLALDSNIKIENIHSVGYKLVIKKR